MEAGPGLDIKWRSSFSFCLADGRFDLEFGIGYCRSGLRTADCRPILVTKMTSQKQTNVTVMRCTTKEEIDKCYDIRHINNPISLIAGQV